MKNFSLLGFHLFGELMLLDALTGCALLEFQLFGKLNVVLDALTGCVLQEFHLCGELVLLDALTGCVFLLEFQLFVELVLLHDLTGHMYLFLLEFQLLFELMLWGQLMADLFGDLHVVMLKKEARLGEMVRSDVLKACLLGEVVQV